MTDSHFSLARALQPMIVLLDENIDHQIAYIDHETREVNGDYLSIRIAEFTNFELTEAQAKHLIQEFAEDPNEWFGEEMEISRWEGEGGLFL